MKWRRFTALLAAFTVLFALWTPMAVTAETPTPAAAEPQAESPAYFGRSVLAKMKNGTALCYAYDRLVEGCAALSGNIDIAHRTHCIDSDEAFLVWELVTNDHPEFFWLSDGISLQGTATTITAFLPIVPADAAATRTALNQRVAELTADLAGKSDYEKSLLLHDRVANATVYQSSICDQNAVGSLLMGQSVCAGYARGYQLLLQAVGIPAYVVTGYSLGQAHAWNLVQLDGEWYYTDVTWDDQNDNGNYIYYAYLNLPYEWMALDHNATHLAEYLPQSTATAANYHIKNGTAMATPNVDKIVALYEAGLPLRLYATEGIANLIAGLSEALGQIVSRVACPYSGYSCGYGYMGQELILQLTVTKPHAYNGGNTCQNCGYVKVENHHYVSTTTAATCLEDGKTVYTCEICGDNYTEIIPAIGHHYVAEVTEPTCGQDGQAVYTCTYCADTYTEILPGSDHNIVVTPGYAPTCSTSGLSDKTQCTICGEILTDHEFLYPLGHQYDEVVTEPTCENAGYTTYTCAVCGDVWSYEDTDPLGHDYEMTILEPTCAQAGAHVYTCRHCGDSYSTNPIPATGEHVYDNDTDATCNVCGHQREVATPGDVDGNGKLNNRDLGLLQQYVNEWDVTVNFANADLDGNSKVNNRDLGLLQQLLNA